MLIFIGFGIGFMVGAMIVQMHHDSLWGQFNHTENRPWDWRPKFYKHLGKVPR